MHTAKARDAANGKPRWRAPALLIVGAVAVVAGCTPRPRGASAAADQSFSPPPDSAIPGDALGREIALGRRIFTDTGAAAPQFVDNDLKCSNCHLDAGRRQNSAPLWGAYGLYPKYRAKNGHVNSFDERLAECFRYSMNGRQPPPGDPTLVALATYAAFLARGAPIGVTLPGAGYRALGRPTSPPDPVRGRAVFQAQCAACHGQDGAGQKSGSAVIIPPLWGPRSFNWGAGMGEIGTAAAFIKANMPLGQGGKLTAQQAWDVADFVDTRPRPQDPRYKGSVAATRRAFHDTPQSAYGEVVDGVLLGGDGPPRDRR